MYRHLQPMLRVPTLYYWTEAPTWVGLDLNSKTDPIQQLIQFTLAHSTPILLRFVQYVWCTRTKPHSTSFCQDDMYFRYSHTYSLFCTYVSKLLTDISSRCMKTCERTSWLLHNLQKCHFHTNTPLNQKHNITLSLDAMLQLTSSANIR
jgi:hypothetical protein